MIRTGYKVEVGTPCLMRLAEMNFFNGKDGKPIGINSHIGRRPIAAFGNSAGDAQMLESTGAGDGAGLMMLVFHDDAERDYAYGPADGEHDTKFGTLPQDLMDQAPHKGWRVRSGLDSAVAHLEAGLTRRAISFYIRRLARLRTLRTGPSDP